MLAEEQAQEGMVCQVDQDARRVGDTRIRRATFDYSELII